MKKKKPNVYIPETASNLVSTAVGFIIWGVLLLIALSAYAFVLNNQRLENNKFFSEQLKNVTDTCTLETTVKYDVEPIDFVLVSPSGSRYAADGCDGYIIDKNQKTIKMTIHTKDTGTWKIDRNQKGNSQVFITTEQLPEEELYITRVSLIPDQKIFNFTVKFDSDKRFTQEIKAIATMKSDSLDVEFELFNDIVEVNRTNQIKLAENQIPYADDWQLTIETRATGNQLLNLQDPLGNPSDTEGLNVKTYTGNTEVLYRRNYISVKEEEHNTEY